MNLTVDSVPVSAPALRPTVTCDSPMDPAMQRLCAGLLGFETRRAGASFVIELNHLGGSLLVEVLPVGGARAFYRADPGDLTEGPYCGGALGGGSVMGMGELALDPAAFTTPASAHGTLDIAIDAGGSIRVAF